MEIAPNFPQYSSELLDWIVVVAAGCLSWGALHWTGRLLRLKPNLKLTLSRSLSLVTIPPAFGAALHPGGPSLADTKVMTHQDTSALYERVPPPRSLVKAEDTPLPLAHPALHGSLSAGGGTRLFPRESGNGSPTIQPWERGAIDLRRTERQRNQDRLPQAAVERGTPSHHVVAPGDTLWDLAAKFLDTDDPRAIARYWPRLHKENVEVIGRDPNLLRPGQVLSLPPKEEA